MLPFASDIQLHNIPFLPMLKGYWVYRIAMQCSYGAERHVWECGCVSMCWAVCEIQISHFYGPAFLLTPKVSSCCFGAIKSSTKP